MVITKSVTFSTVGFGLWSSSRSTNLSPSVVLTEKEVYFFNSETSLLALVMLNVLDDGGHVRQALVDGKSTLRFNFIRIVGVR